MDPLKQRLLAAIQSGINNDHHNNYCKLAQVPCIKCRVLCEIYRMECPLYFALKLINCRLISRFCFAFRRYGNDKTHLLIGAVGKFWCDSLLVMGVKT